MLVLWVASVYPNPYQPNNNAELKNAAMALSKLVMVDVIHVVQRGSEKSTKEGSIHDKQNNYREMIYSFNFTPWGNKKIDSWRYNIKYRLFYNNLLHNYIQQFGKPSIIHVHEPLLAGSIIEKKAVVWEATYYLSLHKKNFNPEVFTSKFYKTQLGNILKNAKTIFTDSQTIIDTITPHFKLKKIQLVSTTHQTEEEVALAYLKLYQIQPKEEQSINLAQL